MIHDDLPYIDDSSSRRGQPSSHELYGTDMAILAGDALLSRAFQHIVSHTPSQLVPQPRLLRVVEEIARSVGSSGMAAGQFLEIEGDSAARESKCGQLGQCSAVCGGLLGGASDDEIERLREYGRIVGVLYRVVEDTVEGKTDSKVAMEIAEQLKSRAKKELNAFQKYGDKVLPLHSFVDYAAERL